MNREEVLAKINAIIKDILVEVDEEQLQPEAKFRETLGADSLDLVELIMAFEDEFDARIPDEDARGITTIGEAVDYVMAHQGAGE